MSLILDALKKSEAERRRGLPPGLSTTFGPARRRNRTPWVAGAGAVVLVAGLAGGWVLLGRSRDVATPDLATATTSAPTNATTGTPAVPAPEIPQVAAASVPPSPVVVETALDAPMAEPQQAFGGGTGEGNGGSVSGGGLPMPQRAGLFTPSATPDTGIAGQAPPPAPVEVTPPAPEVSPPQPEVAASVATPAVAPPVAATETPLVAAPPPKDMAALAADTPVPGLDQPHDGMLSMYQLPYAVRKDLPKLDLSMHVYSPVREERFIVLNGKRFSLDSPPPGPELNLLDIFDEGVVLEFRGQKFLLPRSSY